jgi:RNA recognition motif-containing protein
MATKLYVGNLSYSSTDQSLHSLFSEAGTVTSSQVVTDKYTGQSRGFGFVEMSTEAEAQNAINSLNGKEVDGRTLTVNESKPRDNSGGGSQYRGGGGGGGGRSSNNRSGGSRW